jgi:hypothetical protein
MFHEAVIARNKLKNNPDIALKLGGRYFQRDGKEIICAACKMYLLSAEPSNVIEHFAFYHTEDMTKMLKDQAF